MEVAAGWIKYGLFSLLFLISVGDVRGTLVLLGRNVSIAFDDMEASFAPSVKSSGECGVFYLADPLDACSPLNNKNVYSSNSSFALIIRGGCAFDKKVMAAQEAGYKAAIIYDNEENGDLVPMSGDPHGIRIYAVFITKASGETLKKFAGVSGLELWILPSFDNSTWSILAISFISLLAMLAVLATCFFVRRHRVHRERPRAPLAPEFHGMSSQLVKAMPSLIFTTVQGDNCTSMTCAICLEDYSPGDMIRILPCLHKFHAICVDMWLTSWRTFCPVCKQDARSNTKIPPASECTPLLSGGPASPDITTVLSSLQSIAASPAIPIMSSPPHSLSSRNHSLSSTPHVLNQLRSFSNSPTISIISRSNGSSIDHRNLLFHQSYAPYSLASSVPSRFASPRVHSSGYASQSYLTCPRITSPHINSSGYGSPSYLVG